MADLDIPSLKVAELKAELSKRELSTKGLKAELAARLTEAVAQQDNEATQGDAPTQEEPAEPAQAASEPSQPPEEQSDGVAMAVDTEGNANAPDTVQSSASAAESTEPKETAQNTDNEVAQAPKLGNDRQKSPAAAESEAVVANQAKATEAHDDRESKREESVQEAQPQTVAPNESQPRSQSDQRQSSGQNSSAQEKGLDTSQTNLESLSTTDATPVMKPDESEERKRKREGPVQEASGPSTTAPSEDTQQRPTASETKRRRLYHSPEGAKSPVNGHGPTVESDLSTPPPAQCIFINDLARPFSEGELREGLEPYGRVEKAWIDKLKSHAYVQLESTQAAQKAKEAIHKTKWPYPTSKVITVTFIPPTAMDALLKEEEQAIILKKGRQELDYSFEDGEWRFKLVPYGTASHANSAASNQPQQVIRGLASAVPLASRGHPQKFSFGDVAPPAHPRGLDDRFNGPSARRFDSRAPPPTGRDYGDSRRNAADAYSARSSRPSGPPPRPPPGGNVTRAAPALVYKPRKSL